MYIKKPLLGDKWRGDITRIRFLPLVGTDSSDATGEAVVSLKPVALNHWDLSFVSYRLLKPPAWLPITILIVLIASRQHI